jgi:hypothetical protein
MADGPLLLHDLASAHLLLSLAGFALAAFLSALLVAAALHCVYDLGLRGVVHSIVLSVHRHRLPKGSGDSDIQKKVALSLVGIEERLSFAILSLPPSQLCGQIAASYDADLAERQTGPMSPEQIPHGPMPPGSMPSGVIKPGSGGLEGPGKLESDLQGKRARAERLLDSLQVRLSWVWKCVDVLLAVFLAVGLYWFAASEGSLLWTGPDRLSAFILVGFTVVLVPQLRAAIERLARIR